MKGITFFKLFGLLCLVLAVTLPISAGDQVVGRYFVEADEVMATFVFTGLGEQGFYVLQAKGKESQTLGQPFFVLDDHWVGGLKFNLMAGGIPLPPYDKPYKVRQAIHGFVYYKTILVQTLQGIRKVNVKTIPKEDAPKKIAELSGQKVDAKMKVKLPAPIIGKGVSFKLSFEEAYHKALLDLLTKARKGGYIPPYIPLKFQIYKQHITPMIGTFPPHFALEVYLIAPWPQD